VLVQTLLFPKGPDDTACDCRNQKRKCNVPKTRHMTGPNVSSSISRVYTVHARSIYIYKGEIRIERSERESETEKERKKERYINVF
jgi:hypothetical protein